MFWNNFENYRWLTRICTIYLQQNQYKPSSCLSRCQYLPETLILTQKNNMGIIGNNVRINKNLIMHKFLGSGRSKILSILGLGLVLVLLDSDTVKSYIYM